MPSSTPLLVLVAQSFPLTSNGCVSCLLQRPDVELALRSTAPTSGDVRPAEPAHATIRPANQQYQLQNIASLDASSTTPTSGDPAESRHSSMATPADTEAITHVHPAQEIGAVHASAAAGDQGVPRITSPGRSQDDGRKAMITMDSHSLGLCRSEEVDGGHSSP